MLSLHQFNVDTVLSNTECFGPSLRKEFQSLEEDTIPLKDVCTATLLDELSASLPPQELTCPVPVFFT